MSSSTPEAEALALLAAGRLAEAQAAWRAILARNPDDARALHFLGCALAQAGHAAEGLALVDRSLALAPRDAAFLNNRARLLADAGRADEAIADLTRAVRWEPGFAAAWLHLGTMLRSAGRADESIAALRRAASLEPGKAGHHASLARALLERGDGAEAVRAFEHALALDPGNPEVLNNLALALHAAGDVDAALARYGEALAARPRFPEALVNWGNALKDRGDLEGASAMYARALAQQPQNVEALVNAASAALDRERPGEARVLYERALAARPGAPDARYGLGQLALREQRYDAGWAGYECRFGTRPPLAAARAIALPRLSAATLAGARRVAVWSEQGVGDQVLYSTLLPELERLGIGAVVEVDPRLAGMYRRSLPAFQFVTRDESAAAFSSCDAQVPIGSLPMLFRADRASFARQPRALLRPDPRRVDEARARLGPGRWVAISWRSLQKGPRRSLAQRKSIPLEAFAAFAQASGARLLDVQHGDVDAERAQFMARHPGVLARLEGLDAWHDLEGVAAAIAACDRAVMASNATAHLAGAIGHPSALVYLRAWPPFPYWAAGPDGHCPWYPSVRIVTGEGLEDWEEALLRAAALG